MHAVSYYNCIMLLDKNNRLDGAKIVEKTN